MTKTNKAAPVAPVAPVAAPAPMGALAAAFIAFHKADVANEGGLRAALKNDAGNVDLKPLATGIILKGGAAWCKENANTHGAAFFQRTLDAAKLAADEMALEGDMRKGFINPLRAKIQRAIVALSGLDVKAVKASAGKAPVKDKTAGANPGGNQPASEPSEADGAEGQETVRRKVEHAATGGCQDRRGSSRSCRDDCDAGIPGRLTAKP